MATNNQEKVLSLFRYHDINDIVVPATADFHPGGQHGGGLLNFVATGKQESLDPGIQAFAPGKQNFFVATGKQESPFATGKHESLDPGIQAFAPGKEDFLVNTGKKGNKKKYSKKPKGVPRQTGIPRPRKTGIPRPKGIGVLPKGKHFSIFKRAHADEAATTYNYLISLDNDDFFPAAELLKLILNEGIYLYAITVAMLHRPDTVHIPVPPIWEMNIRSFFTATAIHNALIIIYQEKGGSVLPSTDEDIQQFFTGNKLDPEFKVSWWREDVELNAHHYHFHQVYPWKGVARKDADNKTKDRQGEIFYYMHEQMLARYDAERLAVGLPRVRPYDNWKDPIPEGYASHLTDYYGTHQYSARPSGMTLADNFVDDPDNPVLVDRLVYHHHKILDAINNGIFTTPSTEENVPVNIDNLGAAIESSISSPNPDMYGSVHNYGHDLLSIITDPDGRYQQAYGVMGDTGTAIRDPIFFRWHKFVDNIFAMHKKTLEPYVDKDLLFDGISVQGMKINQTNQDEDVLTTRMKERTINIAEDMFLYDRSKIKSKENTAVNVKVQQVHHEEFTYHFTVTSNVPVKAAFRVFMAPKHDHHGKRMKLNDQRRMFIEMDTFVKSLTDGKNVIKRSSNLSSVIKPPGKSYDEILDLLKKSPDAKKTPGDDACECRDQRYCTCGWPLHMLVPRGTPDGMTFDLFVMLTDWAADRVNTDNLDQGTSYCGVKNEKYPDKRAMGFPFDRRFDSNDEAKEDIVAFAKGFDNMMTISITVRFK